MNNVQLAGFLKKEIRKAQSELEVEDNKAVSVTTNGTTVVSPTSGKDVMESVTITTAVPLPVHETNKTATIDVSEYSEPVEITPSANKDVMDKATVTLTGIPALEANKTATIDVSTYTEPVEVTPSSGKDGMKKATVTLSNIPSGGGATAYAWKNTDTNIMSYLDVNVSPENQQASQTVKAIGFLNNELGIGNFFVGDETYTRISDTEFSFSYDNGGETVVNTLVRDSTKDVTLWELSE